MPPPRNIFSLFSGVLLGLFLLQACGDLTTDDAADTDDGTFSEETITLAVTVAEPVAADLSVPALTIGKKGLALKSPVMVTEAGASYDVMVRDLNGFPTIYTCTTDTTGACEIEIPADLAEEGANIIADNGSIVMRSMVANTPEAVSVNPGTDVTAAFFNVLRDEVDPPSFIEAMDGLVSDAATRTDHEEGSMGEVFSNLVAANEELILSLAGNDLERSVNMMRDALADEDPAAIEALGVSIPDGTLADTNTAANVIADAYCDPADPVLADVAADAVEAGLDVDDAVKTAVTVIAELEPDEISEISITEFQNQALAVTAVNDLVTQGATNPEVRRAMAEMIRQGAMADSDFTSIEQAMGLLVATFPEDLDFSASNPVLMARTANLFNAEYASQVPNAGDRLSPSQLASLNAAALRDPSRQLAIANGGRIAFIAYMTNLIADGAAFDASAHTGDFTEPPGGSCTTDSDCAASLCVSSVCTADTTTLGGSCTTASDCTSGEFCAGYHRNRFCMRASDVPDRVRIFRSGETSPVLRSEAPPDSGGAGSACPCSAGFTCTSNTAGFGVCRPNTLTGYKAPGMMCLNNAQCVTGTCSTGRCAFTTSFLSGLGTLEDMGAPCTSHYQCQSMWCSTAGVCDANPNTSLFTGGGMTLGSTGASCTAGYQCSSSFCDHGLCAGFTGSTAGTTFTPGTKTSGQPCAFTGECVPPLACVSGTCAGFGSGEITCSATSECNLANQYCKESTGTCVAKSTVGGDCTPSNTSTSGQMCATGVICNTAVNQCQQGVIVTATLPAPVTNKNARVWIGTVASYSSALFSSPAILTNGSQVTAGFLGVPAGTYFVGAWVDINSDSSINGVLNLADLKGFYDGPTGANASKSPASKTAVVPSSGIANFSFPIYTVPRLFVTISVPPGATNKLVRIVVNTVASLDGAPYVFSLPSFTGNSIATQFLNIPAGTYFVAGWVDNDSSNTQNSGDYRGWHNGTVNPPGAASFTVTADGNVTATATTGPVP